MPNILDNEALYNVIVLGGQKSPGQVTLSGHDRKVEWQVCQGPFLYGAFVKFKAIPLVEFTATFTLLRDTSLGVDDFAQWPAFQALIDSTVANPRAPTALDIYHPDLAANGISSVVKSSVGGMTYDGHGGARVAVKFQEYRPPRKWEGSPTAKPAADPNAAMKAEIARLTAQYQATPRG